MKTVFKGLKRTLLCSKRFSASSTSFYSSFSTSSPVPLKPEIEKEVDDVDTPPPQPLEKSTLYIVSTPIGTLRDVTLRALDVLTDADAILCEDTRITRQLLFAHGLLNDGHRVPLIGRATSEIAINRLRQGQSIALVSDAGTPCISDPCSQIVNEVISSGFNVRSVPGASSLLAALAVSGFDVHSHYKSGRSSSDVRSSAERRRHRAIKAGFIVEDEKGDENMVEANEKKTGVSTEGFLYLGFVPPSGPQRKKLLSEAASAQVLSNKAVIFFENGKRIGNLLQDLHTLHALEGVSRSVLICRELTKVHEEHKRFSTLDEACHAYLSPDIVLLGEFVVLLGQTIPHKPDHIKASTSAPKTTLESTKGIQQRRQSS
jgi:16S rRNA C1402 (ribose-2'-O) methylase RsmI